MDTEALSTLIADGPRSVVRSDTIPAVGAALAVALLVAPAALVGSAGATTGADAVGLHRMAAIHQDVDGHWWVLERPDPGLGHGPAVVYEHDDDWDRTGATRALRATGNDSERTAVDIARTESGDWYVLNRSGVVFRYAADWEYTGDSWALPRSGEPGRNARFRGLTRTPAGNWLVTAGGTTVRYGPDLRTVLGTTERVQTGRSTVHGGSLVVIGETVHRYGYDDGRNGTGVGERRARTGFLPGAPAYPIDLARTARGGWWVATADGTVVGYDDNWIHTGVAHQVSSGNAAGRTPGDHITPLILLVPLIDFLVLAGPGVAVLVGGGAFAAYRGSGLDVPVGIVASLAYTYALLYQPYPLRPAFVWGGELLVVVPVVGLAMPVAHAVYHEDASVDAALPYLPVVIASAILLVRIAGG